MKRLIGVLFLMLSGCLAPDGEPSSAADTTMSETTAGDQTAAPAASAQDSTDLMPAPSAVDAGMSWSTCAHRSATAFYRQEWGDGLLPDGYRPTHTTNELAQFRIIALDCEAASIGNHSFIAKPTMAWFGILVEAPADVQGPRGNLYVLDMVTNNTMLQEQWATLGVPSSLGSIGVEPLAYDVSSADGLRVRVEEIQKLELGGNETGLTRLHWKQGDLNCWTDTNGLRELEQEARVIVEGQDGHAAQLTGPLGQTAGLGTVARESGYMTARVCVVP